jgi:proteasome lid subunit RPN8/RPN11
MSTRNSTIEFSTDTYEAIVAHAHEGAPREVCGVLGGERNRSEDGTNDALDADEECNPATRVRSVRRAENVARSPRRTYLIDPEKQLAIMESIEASGNEVVGFYHSHPVGPPRPSPTDESRATWEGYSYVICLPDLPFVGSWRWDGDRFTGQRIALR